MSASLQPAVHLSAVIRVMPHLMMEMISYLSCLQSSNLTLLSYCGAHQQTYDVRTAIPFHLSLFIPFEKLRNTILLL